MKKVVIGIVLFKGEKYLKSSLRSLLRQEYKNTEYIAIDNDPEKTASKYIKEKLPDIYKRIKIYKETTNGHSGGHNFLINKSDGDYYVCASYDMLYTPDFATNAINTLEKNKKYTWAGIKLLKWDFENNVKTNVIDSIGIGISKAHKFWDIAQGKEEAKEYSKNIDIFGASGALTIFKKEALVAIKQNNQYYDEDLIPMHKNDIDMAYNMQMHGQKCLYIANSVCYHDRQVAERSKNPIKNRQYQSRQSRINSFVGQKYVLLKYFSFQYSFSIVIQTISREYISILYALVFEPYCIFAIFKMNIKQALKKRVVNPTQLFYISSLMK